MSGIQSDFTKLLRTLSHSKNVMELAAKLETSTSPVSVKLLHGSAKAVLIATLWNTGAVPFIVVCADDKETADISHDLAGLIGSDPVSVIYSAPSRKTLSDGSALQHDEVDALMRLQLNDRMVLVATAQALTSLLPQPSELASEQLTITRGADVQFDNFITTLSLNGYQRTDYVGKPGEIAVRGGIIDIYPGGWDNPIRLEFWGNTVESIREFEPLSQRSIREHDSVTLLTRVYHTDDTNLDSSFADHVPQNAVVVVVEPELVLSSISNDNSELLTQFDDVKQLYINPLSDADVVVKTTAQVSVGGSIEQLLNVVSGMIKRSLSVYVCAEGQQNTKRIRELADNVADQVEMDADGPNHNYHATIDSTWWVSHSLSAGFVWVDENIAVLTEHQVFGRQRTQKRSRKSETGITMRELNQMHRGDYVVHADKGIGKFDGLTAIEISGSKQECVKLLFEGGDVLYVHLNYVHKLSKFAAEEGALPKLSKLGSPEWERKKQRAKKKIKDIARELIKLYAQRKAQPGYAFPIDTIWQKEFEAGFQYEDTPDQARATAEVKIDMETQAPMDRLVCGDVGFGKTEIAIRAAFKAAQAGKQVAVLVPTTILAQQHYTTFCDRLHRYPVSIEVISRFKTKAQQTEVLERLGKGGVDILIGTHRLLSKDVHFRQLGLLIVDEEHRFGVTAKEKLRTVRSSVDTLTLTATPIPRTLNFSLMGARDLSIIETPPRNRLPIKTEIVEWDDNILVDAILLEMERNGQIFVVTDRIPDIEKLAMRIQMLVPTLKIAQAHGQMPGNELEDVMEGFLERKFDMLIATKIIESGLDIPNANTMIVNNADNFGLAELYQLRGRVGRSNIQAHCYLIIPPVHTLSRISLRRLQALEEFTDLGSGFQLAMRDLEIRGAGNLLGGEQSGFIMEMGFELYQKILDEAVTELRYDEFQEFFGSTHSSPSFLNEDVAIELDVDALLPKSYIPSDADRYDAYKRLYNAHNNIEIEAVFTDLRDRFGVVPPEAENLLFAVQIRIAALSSGVSRVSLRATTLTIEFPPESNSSYYTHAFPVLLPLIASMPNARFVQQKKRLLVEIQLSRREECLQILQGFSDAVTNNVPEPTEEKL
ncbi:MAG: transcription-repair coupling factor [Ignavibacteria bacterium]|nr:transcription-repair coupling factor [Ignavibacteria bacterium]